MVDHLISGNKINIAHPLSVEPLESDQVYLLQLQNIAGAAKPASLVAQWYEHTDAS